MNATVNSTSPFTYQLPDNVSFDIAPTTTGAPATQTLSFNITMGVLESYQITVTYPSEFVFNGFDALGPTNTQIGTYGVDFDFNDTIDFTIPIRTLDNDSAYADRDLSGTFTQGLDSTIEYTSNGNHTFTVILPLGGDGSASNIAGPFSEMATAVLSAGVLDNPQTSDCYTINSSFTSVDPDSGDADDATGTDPLSFNASRKVAIGDGICSSAMKDFTGDGKADILVRNTTSSLWRLHPVEGRFVQFDENFGLIDITSDLTLQTQDVSDYTGDNLADVLLRNTATGTWSLTPLDGKTIVNDANNGSVALPSDLNWQLVAANDFTGDGKTDVVLRHAVNGTWRLYPMDGRSVVQDSNFGSIGITPNLDWQLVAASDFNSDGFADIVLRNQVSGLWLMIPMQGRTVMRNDDFGGIGITQNLAWEVAGARDFTGDDSADLLLRHNVLGQWLLLPLNGKQVDRGDDFGGVRFLATGLEWQPVEVDDFTGDGIADVLIRNNNTGAWRMHPMNGKTVVRDDNFGGVAVTSDLDWELQ